MVNLEEFSMQEGKVSRSLGLRIMISMKQEVTLMKECRWMSREEEWGIEESGMKGRVKILLEMELTEVWAVKTTIPWFKMSDPKAYLVIWKKVKIAALEFTDYTITCWNQVVTARRKNHERPINTWEKLEVIIRKRFVPNYYHREFHKKIAKLLSRF